MFYGAGASANAAKIATEFGATASALTSLPAGHVEVLLGTGPRPCVPRPVLARVVNAVPVASHAPSAASSAADNGAAGGAVTVAANAKYGIPCVYLTRYSECSGGREERRCSRRVSDG